MSFRSKCRYSSVRVPVTEQDAARGCTRCPHCAQLLWIVAFRRDSDGAAVDHEQATLPQHNDVDQQGWRTRKGR